MKEENKSFRMTPILWILITLVVSISIVVGICILMDRARTGLWVAFPFWVFFGFIVSIVPCNIVLEITESKAVRMRQTELLKNFVRITDDFTRPEIYKHRLFYRRITQKAAKNILLSIEARNGGDLLYIETEKVASLKAVIGSQLFDLWGGDNQASIKVQCLFHPPDVNLRDENGKCVSSIKFRLVLNCDDSNFLKNGDFILEGEELEAYLQTLELSEWLASREKRKISPMRLPL